MMRLPVLNLIESTPKGWHPTDIEWADFAFNPLRAVDPRTGKTGWACLKVSEGCAHCYAEAMNKRWGTGRAFTPAGIRGIDLRLDSGVLEAMRRSRPKRAAKSPDGVYRVFWGDMTDLGGEWMTVEGLAVMLAYCAARPDYEHLLLTKRPHHVRSLMKELAPDGHRFDTRGFVTFVQTLREIGGGEADRVEWPLRNVKWGTSVENSRPEVLQRLIELQHVPSRSHFVSFEPLLQGVDPLGLIPMGSTIDWFIVGGESGSSARPSTLEWFRHLRSCARLRGIAFFMKQLGRRVSMSFDEWNTLTGGGSNGSPKFRLDEPDEPCNFYGIWRPYDASGGDLAEFPLDLQLREWPCAGASRRDE